MKGRQIRYSDEELAWVKRNCRMLRREMHRLFVETFGRDDVTLSHLNALCKRRGWMTGRTGHYEKGEVPHNKGQHFSPAGSEKGRFKKGHQPHNTNYLGHERVSKDGYVEVSVAETNHHTGFERRYVLKHRHLWEQVNGPVPAGMALKCLDSNKQNTDPNNWEAIPRALLPRLAGGRAKRLKYDDAPQDLKPVILTTAKLNHKARELKHGGSQ